MIKEAIAVDLDDVLAEHVEAFINFSNKKYGTRLKVQDYYERWAELWQIENDEAERRAAEFHTSENISRYRMKIDSLDALKILSKYYDLYIVTARRKWVIEDTIEWVNKHYPNLFKGIHFVPIWEPNNKVTKAEICKEIGANYLIDDSPQHCNIAATNGIKAIMFGGYPWNNDKNTVDGVTRCTNWEEVLKYFLGYP